MLKHEERSLYGLLLQVANPSLIIAMVGSLIFFLIEIFYRGPHVLRLNLIMALFTIATVLVSRISIEAGKERAAMFAAGLALATLATTSVVVDFEYENLTFLEPVVIIFFIVTVMWVSNRLVWDCTLLGRTRDVSAMGLVEAIRQKVLPKTTSVSTSRKKANDLLANQSTPARPLKEKKSQTSDSFSVFEFMLGRNGKNTTPGLWVFYLAVAAFPIFGFGQWFVNSNSSGFSVFFLFAVYLTSGLGLLMVTSLLGLKRYVNQRGVSIPEPVAMNWLFVGSMFLIGLLLLISFLPRPDLSSTMNDFLVLLGSEKKTSEFAIGEDNDVPDRAEGNQNAKPKLKPQEDQGGKEPDPADAPIADGKRGNQTDANSSEKKDGGGNENSDSKSGKDKDGERKNPDSRDSRSDRGKGGNDQEGNDLEENAEGENDDGENDGSENDENNEGGNGDDDGADQPRGKPPKKEDQKERDGKPNKVAKVQRPPAPPPSIQPDSSGFRWIAYILVGLIFSVILIMYRNELLRLWEQLFGLQKEDIETEESLPSNSLPGRSKPFSSFSDPFASGMAQKSSPEKLMEYSIEALRAWANEHGIDVSGHGTADDLQSAIQAAMGRPHPDLRSFSIIFNRTIYGDHPPNSEDLDTIRRIWRFMKANVETGALRHRQKPAVSK